MQNSTPFSLIVWDNISTLPLPTEALLLTRDIKWEEYEWYVNGLPFNGSKYNMLDGLVLYLTQSENGEVKTERQDEFTGDITLSGFFINEIEPEGDNIFVHLLVTILKGQLVSAKVLKVERYPVVEFKSSMANFNDIVRKDIIRVNAWWFKWLYLPWYYLVRGLGFIVLYFLNILKMLVVYAMNFITPF